MAHLVQRKGKYWSLEESYRDGTKVRKRVLQYFGVMSVDWQYTMRGDGKAFDEPVESVPAPDAVSTLPTGLHVGPIDPVPLPEPAAPIVPSTDTCEPAPAEPSGSVSDAVTAEAGGPGEAAATSEPSSESGDSTPSDSAVQ